MRELWFDPYDRASSGSALGSSGFEHVFMGESKNNEVSGFHNWLKYRYEEDETQTINYYGYLEEQYDLGDVRMTFLLCCLSRLMNLGITVPKRKESLASNMIPI